jgi:hypothetical protein
MKEMINRASVQMNGECLFLHDKMSCMFHQAGCILSGVEPHMAVISDSLLIGICSLFLSYDKFLGIAGAVTNTHQER